MKDRRGFTLIEILLGMAIFSVIGLTLYTTFAVGVELSRRNEVLLRTNREALWTFERMSRDLGKIVAYDFSGSYPDQSSFFPGQASLGFLTASDRGLKAVRYRLRSADDGTVQETVIGETFSGNVAVVTKTVEEKPVVDFVREEQDFGDFLQTGFDGAQSEVMSRFVLRDGLEFSYATKESQEAAELQWVGNWTATFLPQGVRVKLTIAAGDSGEETSWVRDIFIPQGESVGD